MSAVITERLVAVAAAAGAAQHGERGVIYDRACTELGMTRSTLMRRLKDVRVVAPRKRRADAGKTALSRDEAEMVSAMLMTSFRANGKQQSSVKLALERLRANGEISASRADPETGEMLPLSVSAIIRALRQYGLHPDQLLAPAPAVTLASAHPNHVWQVDASICTLFYLPTADGLADMPRAEFYKNKPQNFKRVEKQRLWRYVITDHASGTLYVEYVLGAESAENLCNVFINAMQKRHPSDPFYGVPRAIMTDPGAAMTSSMFRNLCRALAVDLTINEVGNARAKGQVEQAHNLVEREFESGLKLIARPTSLDQVNGLAWRWMRHFNSHAVHSRTQRTRYGVWTMITAEQLRIPPGADVLRELAVSQPESRKVSTTLTVSYRGREFDVSTVPGVMVGERLMVTRNPWRDDDTAQVLLSDADGRDVYHIVEALTRNEFGFREDSPVIGESYARHADTPAQEAGKRIEQIATDTSSQAGAEAAKKSKAVPFGGRIDPYKTVDETPLPTYLPRAGTDHDLVAPRIELPPLTHIQATKQLRASFADWSPRHYEWLQAEYPAGVPADDLGQVAARLRNAMTPALQRPNLIKVA